MKKEDIVFIQEILGSQNIPSHIIKAPFDHLEDIDRGFRASLYEDFDYQVFKQELLYHIKKDMGYYITDQFSLQYLICQLPDGSFLTAGPYTFQFLGEKEYQHLERQFHFPKDKEQELKEYFVSVPNIPSSSSWYSLILTLLKKVYQHEFKMAFETFHFEKKINQELKYNYDVEPILKIKYIEKRYLNENQLLDAIGQGDMNHAIELVNIRHKMKIEARSLDPIRDEKNLLFVQNALYRKRIEQNGTHPYYLDRISGKFARRIETITSEKQANQVSVEMTKAYCEMVLDHSNKGYSPIVQKVVTYIELNLMERLSLSYLANMFHISHSYLSTLFKNETGKTITDYINQKRVDQACLYLRDTDLKVIDIASRVGINDLNYFTKIFKKYKKMTPSHYRQI